jgi:hypothetical protein
MPMISEAVGISSIHGGEDVKCMYRIYSLNES